MSSIKIVDAINKRISESQRFFALEYFPPKTEAGMQNLYQIMQRMCAHHGPSFCGMTWSDDNSTAEQCIEIAGTAQSLYAQNMQVNITCANATEDQMRRWLSALKARGVKNILCNRGQVKRRVVSQQQQQQEGGGGGGGNNSNAGGGVTTTNLSPSIPVVNRCHDQSADDRNNNDPCSGGGSLDVNNNDGGAGGAATTCSGGEQGRRVCSIGTGGSQPGGENQTNNDPKNNDDGGNGKPPDFAYAVDLVRFVRREFGDYFGIAVAGYPEGHVYGPGERNDASSSTGRAGGRKIDYENDLKHLKEKIDAGADVIITQMIFDADVFLKFVQDCRSMGISCPILPGIMPIHSFAQFRRFRALEFAGTDVLEQKFRVIRNDDAEIKRIGKEHLVEIIKKLFRSPMRIRGVYFFTMNMELAVASIIDELNLSGNVQKAFPWGANRPNEEVRPIYWSSRPSSYIARTMAWDEFPNGRWSSSQAPSFREDQTYHTSLAIASHAKHCTKLLNVASLADVCDVFVSFLDGGMKLPWAEEMAPESIAILDNLLKPLNARGFLTINSQPALNGIGSANKYVGWGPKNGYVYQKQYLEFFVSPDAVASLVEVFSAIPSLQFMGLDAKKKHIISSKHIRGEDVAVAQSSASPKQGGGGGGGGGGPNSSSAHQENDTVTVVTWGVFPGREIVQPTIVSDGAFSAWVDEAFELWAAPFEGNDIPPIIQEIKDHWVLFQVVDNEFIPKPTPLTEVLIRDIFPRFPLIVPLLPSPTSAMASSVPQQQHNIAGVFGMTPENNRGSDLQELLGTSGPSAGGVGATLSPAVRTPVFPKGGGSNNQNEM